MDAGWTLGGPIYIPKVFNVAKKANMSRSGITILFPARCIDYGSHGGELTGDFSGHGCAGVLQTIAGSAHFARQSGWARRAFQGNKIPSTRFSQ